MMDDAYPHAPGAQDTDTSREAADAIAPVSGRLRRMALHAITLAGPEGLTAEECANHLGIERVAIQPRTTELLRLGKVKDSGQRRLNASGKRAIVWVAV